MTYREFEGWQMMVFGFGGLMFTCSLWLLRIIADAAWDDLGLIAGVGFPVFQGLIIVVGWLIRREGRKDAHKLLIRKALNLLPSDRENP